MQERTSPSQQGNLHSQNISRTREMRPNEETLTTLTVLKLLQENRRSCGIMKETMFNIMQNGNAVYNKQVLQPHPHQ